MLQPSTLKFLSGLKKNNNKPWFDANRKAYETAKADFAGLVEAVITAAAKFDPSIGHLKAKECMFRINRDVRFSKDKSPYKTNMGASFNKGGKKIAGAGYYFHCEPGGNNFIAGGIYMPMPPDLAKVRQEVDYNWKDFKKILSAKPFKDCFGDLEKTGDMTLSRPPKGYEAENPAIEYIKLKSFIATSKLSDAEMISKDLVKTITKYFKAALPLVEFVNHAMEE
jgi:uncharacterized protein (TIGR02453 family)